jgi:hypothetical protein
MLEAVEKCVEMMHSTFDRTDLDIEWKKIEEKLEEARYSPGDIRPLVDCIFAILLAARNMGYSTDAVFEKLESVAAEYVQRDWKKMPDGTYHVI